MHSNQAGPDLEASSLLASFYSVRKSFVDYGKRKKHQQLFRSEPC